MHAIDGIPRNCQILHVEQEVVGDNTSVLQCILNTDMERTQLLEEEARLLELQVRNRSMAKLLCHIILFIFNIPSYFVLIGSSIFPFLGIFMIF